MFFMASRLLLLSYYRYRNIYHHGRAAIHRVTRRHGRLGLVVRGLWFVVAICGFQDEVLLSVPVGWVKQKAKKFIEVVWI